MNKKSFLESISDTFIGLCINFPLGFTVLVIMTWFTSNPLYISGGPDHSLDNYCNYKAVPNKRVLSDPCKCRLMML